MPSGFSITETPLDEVENGRISMVPERDEIYNTLVTMGPTKAPGPDGYPAIFFQKCWPFVGDDVTNFVQSIFETAVVPQSVCHTFLALLPKIQEPSTASDFRPISLCNVVYKIVTRITTFRIRPIIARLISENQNAFVPGRQICDNFVIANEILHFMKGSKAEDGFFALKVDLAKAYDRVDWKFLSTVLKSFGFLDKTHDLIMSCVTSPTFSVLVNGRARGFFKAGRGLRQGCPLSPYLFILTSELLSRLFVIYERDGLYNGIKINRYAPSISHLLFADDLFLFGKGTDETVATLKEILDKYTSWSGQRVNFHKSAIHFSKTVCKLSRILFPLRLGVKEMKQDDKYLGNFPLLPKHLKSSYNFLLSACRKKLAGWKRNSLSHAGRTVLLKSALANVPVYYLSTGLIPKGIVDKLSQLQRAFWWGHDVGDKKLHLINWDWFIKPKCLGGLGVRDLGIINKALVCKLAWRFLNNPEALWVRLLSAKYIRNSNFWDVNPRKVQSFCWKGILSQREVLKKGCCWSIGSGHKVRIWDDPWVPRLHNYRISSEGDSDHNANVKLVSDLIDHDTGRWRMSLLHSLFDNTTVEAITKIKLDYINQADELIWMRAKNGLFSTKSAYQEIVQSLPSSSQSSARSSNSWNHFWNLSYLSPKVHLFLWKLLHNGLGVASKIHGIMDHIDGLCPICGRYEETLEHAFLHCDHSRASWLQSPMGLRTSLLQGDLISIIWDWIEHGEKHTINLAANMLWTVWKHRWKNIREGVALQPSLTVREACLLGMNNVSTETRPSNTLLNEGDVELRNMNTNLANHNSLVQINTDGGVRNSIGAAAAVVTDSSGRFIFAKTVVEDSNNVAYMEAVAIKLGLLSAQTLGIKELRLVSDALGIVEAINDINHNYPWQARMVVREIQRLQKQFNFCSIRFIRRDSNLIADVLVTEALNCNSSQEWEICPMGIQPLVTQ